jgi:hypothetical protein
MPTPRLTDPYFDIDAGKYDAVEDAKQKKAFMDMTVGMYDKGKKRRVENEVEAIFANADMTTPEGVTSAISQLYKVEGVGPKLAQELRAFALQEDKAQTDLKNAETLYLQMLNVGKDKKFKRVVKIETNKFLTNREEKANTVREYMANLITADSGGFFSGWGDGHSDVTEKDLANVKTKRDAKRLLARYGITDLADVKKYMKEIDELHLERATSWGYTQGESILDSSKGRSRGKGESLSNKSSVAQIVNTGEQDPKILPDETPEKHLDRQERARKILKIPSDLSANLIKATDKYANARKIYSEMEDPSAPTLFEPEEGYVQKGLKNISGYGQLNELYSRPEFISQKEGMLRGVKPGPLPDQVGRKAYATLGVPPVGNRTAPSGGSRMLSSLKESSGYGKSNSMPAKEFRELAEDISKGWEKLSRQDQKQTIQFATQYAESDPNISAKELASKFKIPLAFAQEIIRVTTAIRNRQGSYLTNR